MEDDGKTASVSLRQVEKYVKRHLTSEETEKLGGGMRQFNGQQKRKKAYKKWQRSGEETGREAYKQK